MKEQNRRPKSGKHFRIIFRAVGALSKVWAGYLRYRFSSVRVGPSVCLSNSVRSLRRAFE